MGDLRNQSSFLLLATPDIDARVYSMVNKCGQGHATYYAWLIPVYIGNTIKA